MKIKKIVALTAACAMLSSTAGCQIITIDGEGTAEVGENGVVGNGAIGLSVSTLNNPFFVSLAEGAQAEAEEKGAELITVDAGDDAAKQTNDVEDLISRNVSVLIVNPVDSDAVAPAVKDAISKGIKVISGRRTCPHRKIYIYPQIHGTCCIAADVRYKAGRDQRSASFKRIRQNHYHSRNKIYSQRSSSHHSRRRSAGKDPPDRQCGFSGKGCIRADGGRERTNGKNSLV